MSYNPHAIPVVDTGHDTYYVIIETRPDGTRVPRFELGIIHEQNKNYPLPTTFYAHTDFGRLIALEADRIHIDAETYARLSLARVPNSAWRNRERFRFDTGRYSPLPKIGVAYQAIPDHFAHVAMSNGAMVAYTQNVEKGERDIQTLMRPGRYFQKYYSDVLSPDEINDLAKKIDNSMTLRFATTGEEVVEVYQNGPRSCMRYPNVHHSWYYGHIHPCSVYGDESDLILAYLGNGEPGQPGFRATARALIDKRSNTYMRVYGDETRIRDCLREAGFKPTDTFESARIKRIEDDHGNGYIMPYIDGEADYCRFDGNMFVIGEYGEIRAQSICGTTEEEDRNFCEYHEEYTNENLVYIRNLNQYWSQSAADNHAFYCHGYGDHFSDDECAFDVDGETYSESYCSDHFDWCEYNERYVSCGVVEATDKHGYSMQVSRDTVNDEMGTSFWEHSDGEIYTYVEENEESEG